MTGTPRAHARHNLGVLFTQSHALFAAANFVMASFVLRETSAVRFAALSFIVVALLNSLWQWLSHSGLSPRLHSAESGDAAAAPVPARLWLLIGLHSLAATGGFICLWTALDLIPAHVCAILSRAEAAVGVTLGLLWLKERFSGWQWLGLLLTAAGVLIVRWTSLAGENLGFLLMIASALSFGLSEVLGKLCVRYVPVPRLACIRSWIVCALLCALWLATDPGWPQLSGGLWAWLIASAVIGPGLARNAYLLASSYLPVSEVMVLNQTQPLYAAVLAFALLGESLALKTYIGAAVLIAGVVTMVRGRSRQEDSRQENSRQENSRQ